MEIVYWRSLTGNFGDDLNEVVWPSIFSERALNAPDIVLAGIGSLLDEGKFRDVATKGKQVFVLGSGAALGLLPPGLRQWRILSVRGPLTASLLDRPEAAVTDSAILLAALPTLIPKAPRRDAVLFMPHFETLEHCDWAAISLRAGLEFVDPRWPPAQVLEAYSRAKLMVTEAMHGAIVADTLRIPWIPVLISPNVNVFKWKDWTSSMDLPLNFVSVPPGSSRLMLRHLRMKNQARAADHPAPGALPTDAPLQHYIDDFRARYAVPPQQIGPVSTDFKRRAVAAAGKATWPIMSILDKRYRDYAVHSLRRAAGRSPYLSSDTVFQDRLERTLSLVSVVENAATR